MGKRLQGIIGSQLIITFVESIDLNFNNVEYKLTLSKSIDNVSKVWSELSQKTIFSNYDYLKLLESHGPLGYNYYYAVIYFKGNPVALIYFQRKRVHLSEDFRVHSHKDSFLENIKVGLLKTFFSFVKHDILICGNVLLTGEYAYTQKQDFEFSSGLFDLVFEKTISFIKSEDNIKIQSVLCKDFYISGAHHIQSFSSSNFFEFQVQPAMILNIDSEWKSYEDYLASVKSKYRVKFKKVVKKGSGLEYKKLSVADAQLYNDQMYSLYKATADRATFSLFTLDPNYFAKLKETLGEKLQLTAVLDGEKLVGFFTFVSDGEHGDAHFLGYDVTQNSKYQLYFNMLLKLIDESINQRSKYLNLSRTALEIKSSVGAEPHDMYVYLKHQNKLINKILPSILNRVVPKNSWEQRSPFK